MVWYFSVFGLLRNIFFKLTERRRKKGGEKVAVKPSHFKNLIQLYDFLTTIKNPLHSWHGYERITPSPNTHQKISSPLETLFTSALLTYFIYLYFIFSVVEFFRKKAQV